MSMCGHKNINVLVHLCLHLTFSVVSYRCGNVLVTPIHNYSVFLIKNLFEYLAIEMCIQFFIIPQTHPLVAFRHTNIHDYNTIRTIMQFRI